MCLATPARNPCPLETVTPSRRCRTGCKRKGNDAFGGRLVANATTVKGVTRHSGHAFHIRAITEPSRLKGLFYLRVTPMLPVHNTPAPVRMWYRGALPMFVARARGRSREALLKGSTCRCGHPAEPFRRLKRHRVLEARAGGHAVSRTSCFEGFRRASARVSTTRQLHCACGLELNWLRSLRGRAGGEGKPFFSRAPPAVVLF